MTNDDQEWLVSSLQHLISMQITIVKWPLTAPGCHYEAGHWLPTKTHLISWWWDDAKWRIITNFLLGNEFQITGYLVVLMLQKNHNLVRFKDLNEWKINLIWMSYREIKDQIEMVLFENYMSKNCKDEGCMIFLLSNSSLGNLVDVGQAREAWNW